MVSETHDRTTPQPESHQCSTHPSALIVELREHIPFSVSAVALGLVVAGAICILGATLGAESMAFDGGISEATGAIHDHATLSAEEHSHGDSEHAGHRGGAVFARLFFHLFHPAHMLFSAAATAAMFMRYERRMLKAAFVGLLGAVGVCGISDIVVPQMSLSMLDAAMPWHLCVIEHPGVTLPFAGIGVLIGISMAGGSRRGTIISHSLHVLASTMASIFYMVGPLGLTAWIDRIGTVFVFVILAVVIPCCVSDIVFPMLMSGAGRQRYEQEPHVH